MAHEINVSTGDRENAMTLCSDLSTQGFDVAVWSDLDNTYYVLDGKPQANALDPTPEGALVLEYDPGKGIPVVTESYRGPDRRRSPRGEFRAPIKVSLMEKVGHACVLLATVGLLSACAIGTPITDAIGAKSFHARFCPTAEVPVTSAEKMACYDSARR